MTVQLTEKGNVVQLRKKKKSKDVHFPPIKKNKTKNGAAINKCAAGPLNVVSVETASSRQTLSCQLLRIIPVLVDLCQRADKSGPLVVAWNCDLLRDTTQAQILKLCL